MTRPCVYVAGPLFDDGERWWVEQIEARVAAAGFDTFLPHRDGPPKTADNVPDVFAADVAALRRCDLVVASLNGIGTDDGTAWELGFAYAVGTPTIGVYTDWRSRFEHQVVNLMLECGLQRLVRSLDELDAVLRSPAEIAPVAQQP